MTTAKEWLALCARFEALGDKVYAMWERPVGKGADNTTTWRIYPKDGVRSADGHDERFHAEAKVAARYLVAAGVTAKASSDPTSDWLNIVQARTRADSDISITATDGDKKTEGGVIENLTGRSATTCVMLAGDVAPTMVRSADTVPVSGRRPRLVLTYTDDGREVHPSDKKIWVQNRGDADGHDVVVGEITTGERTLRPDKISFLPMNGQPVEVTCSVQWQDDNDRARSRWKEGFADELSSALRQVIDAKMFHGVAPWIQDGTMRHRIALTYRDYDGNAYRNDFVVHYTYALERFEQIDLVFSFAITPEATLMVDQKGATGLTANDWLSWIAGFFILGLVSYIIVRDRPFNDPNTVVFVRILLAAGVGLLSAGMAGRLHIDGTVKGLGVRAGGPLALAFIAFIWSPSVLKIEGKEKQTPAIEAPAPAALPPATTIAPTSEPTSTPKKETQTKVGSARDGPTLQVELPSSLCCGGDDAKPILEGEISVINTSRTDRVIWKLRRVAFARREEGEGAGDYEGEWFVDGDEVKFDQKIRLNLGPQEDTGGVWTMRFRGLPSKLAGTGYKKTFIIEDRITGRLAHVTIPGRYPPPPPRPSPPPVVLAQTAPQHHTAGCAKRRNPSCASPRGRAITRAFISTCGAAPSASTADRAAPREGRRHRSQRRLRRRDDHAGRDRHEHPGQAAPLDPGRHLRGHGRRPGRHRDPRRARVQRGAPDAGDRHPRRARRRRSRDPAPAGPRGHGHAGGGRRSRCGRRDGRGTRRASHALYVRPWDPSCTPSRWRCCSWRWRSRRTDQRVEPRPSTPLAR